MPDVSSAQRNQRLGSTRGCDELNLERIGSVDLDDSPKIAPTKSSVRGVACQNYRV